MIVTTSRILCDETDGENVILLNDIYKMKYLTDIRPIAVSLYYKQKFSQENESVFMKYRALRGEIMKNYRQ